MSPKDWSFRDRPLRVVLIGVRPGSKRGDCGSLGRDPATLLNVESRRLTHAQPMDGRKWAKSVYEKSFRSVQDPQRARIRFLPPVVNGAALG